MRRLSSKMKRRIKRKLSGEKPTIWVGKSGVSKELLSEVAKQLKKNEIIKVKILESALEQAETKPIASRIAAETEASLIEVRGHTFMLYKRRKK